jgi:hypothetical protein
VLGYELPKVISKEIHGSISIPFNIPDDRFRHTGKNGFDRLTGLYGSEPTADSI